ncbi:exported protein of unknown function (plasmid) [Ralstonia solanacearum CMR15]|nr:exported protein of unknown function [Ralstonia solanacearum CMR15]
MLATLRAVPALMVMFWAYFLIPMALGVAVPETATVVAAMGAAYIAQSLQTGLRAVGAGQRHAALALGMSPGHALLAVVLPQAWRIMLPSIANQWVSTVKDTSLAYIVSVVELSTAASEVNSRIVRLSGGSLRRRGAALLRAVQRGRDAAWMAAARGAWHARPQSIWSCSRRRLSSAKCNRSQTPLACQSCRRRQHVMPLPKPSSLGRLLTGYRYAEQTECRSAPPDHPRVDGRLWPKASQPVQRLQRLPQCIADLLSCHVTCNAQRAWRDDWFCERRLTA